MTVITVGGSQESLTVSTASTPMTDSSLVVLATMPSITRENYSQPITSRPIASVLSASVSGRECKSPATNHRELALQIGGERARQETDASSVTRAKVGRWARGISALDLVVDLQLSRTLTKQKRTEPDLPPPPYLVCMRRERKRSATGSARAGALA